MNYHKIEKTSVANGTGIRIVLWCSGCSVRCRNCQNPSTWDVNSGKLFDDNAKKELFESLDKSYIQGITFSGGHPLENENLEVVYELIVEIRNRFPDKDIWLYTGLKWESIMNSSLRDINTTLRKRIVELCDVVVDGAYIEALKDITLKWRGSSNQRVIDVKKTIEQNEIVLYSN